MNWEEVYTNALVQMVDRITDPQRRLKIIKHVLVRAYLAGCVDEAASIYSMMEAFEEEPKGWEQKIITP